MVEEHVLRLQVSVDDTILVQASECLNELCRVEHGSPLRELLVLAQVIEQLTSIEEIHDEVELGWCLEGIVQLHDEWAVDFL